MDSEFTTRVLTFYGNQTELKKVTRHPISVYNLYREKSLSASESNISYWQTIGDKYLAVDFDGQLILQEESTTKFLMVNETITDDQAETFYICAIKEGKSYLAIH
jgi:hypothetical protein